MANEDVPDAFFDDVIIQHERLPSPITGASGGVIH
jgi:hypothetical protein